MSAHINPDYIITLQGEQYCTYRGVLDCAHSLGLEGIRTRLLQVPGPDNDYVAIVEAEVRMKDGRVFTDVADASPRNVSARMANALIRMASTRAKGRALRDAVNIGEALAEELPDVEGEVPVPARVAPARATSVPQRTAAPSARPLAGVAAVESEAQELPTREGVPEAMAQAPSEAVAAPSAPEELVCSNPDCGRSITQGQYNYSVKTYGAALCPQCQRKRQAQGKTL